VVYVEGTIDGAGVVVAFRIGSGHHLWKTAVGRPRGARIDHLVLTPDRTTVFGAASEWSLFAMRGYAFAMNARSGELSWDRRVVPTSDDWDTYPVGAELGSEHLRALSGLTCVNYVA
jgi:outer membrane protein assembly factor BamB